MNKKYDFVVYRISSDQKCLIPEVCVPLGELQKVHDEQKDSISVTKEQDEPVEYWNMRRLVLESGEPRYASIMVPMKNYSHPALVFWKDFTVKCACFDQSAEWCALRCKLN